MPFLRPALLLKRVLFPAVVPCWLLPFLHFFQSGNGSNQHGTPPRDNTLFNNSAGRRKGILSTMLLLFQFDLGGSADFDHAYTAGKLGQALLELLAIVVAGCPLDECTDLAYTSLDLIS